MIFFQLNHKIYESILFGTKLTFLGFLVPPFLVLGCASKVYKSFQNIVALLNLKVIKLFGLP